MQLYDKLRKPFSSLIYIFMGVWFELMGRWRRFLVIYVEKLWQIILTDMVSESTRKLYYISPLLWTMAITSLHKFFSTFIDIKWRWLSLAIFFEKPSKPFFFLMEKTAWEILAHAIYESNWSNHSHPLRTGRPIFNK